LGANPNFFKQQDNEMVISVKGEPPQKGPQKGSKNQQPPPQGVSNKFMENMLVKAK